MNKYLLLSALTILISPFCHAQLGVEFPNNPPLVQKNCYHGTPLDPYQDLTIVAPTDVCPEVPHTDTREHKPGDPDCLYTNVCIGTSECAAPVLF